MDESYDAIVVGSGYGGSVAACRMSTAGINVCLIEKGRKWEAHDFPQNVTALGSAIRLEFRKWGFGLGSKQALFQIHDQGDSLAAVACGLGGGSLVNAGVLVPTPARAKRDHRWLKEWNKDWEIHEQMAFSMLGAQNAPLDFPSAQVMRQVVKGDIEDYRPDLLKLSINFEKESKDTGRCLACGNCLSGCPYNAKNSTDKNYLASAIQDGCVIKTEREVLYVLENLDTNTGEHNDSKQIRRWRVYFDDLEYISADFVVLSAGVLGTSELLFQSRKRGLKLSEKLGHGLSCNGNNVAYITGSEAPLHATGLAKSQFVGVPFQNRPGPAITSSYTSSSGFTIQSGVLPQSYPYLLFKGIVTYGWPTGFCFLHGLIDKFKYSLGFKDTESVVLNAMGYDACNGVITLNEDTNKINITPPQDPLLPKKVRALQNLAKRLGGILFMSRYRSTSVHLLGGCNAAIDPSDGVCNPNGQVFNVNNDKSLVHKGLYISDASLIPCSIGINPCLTITALSEHVSRHLVKDVLKFKSCYEIKEENLEANFKNLKCAETNNDKVTVRETMKGFIGGMPCTAYLVMKMNSTNNDLHGHDPVIGDSHSLLQGRVGGNVILKAVDKDKLYIVDGNVNMCKVDSRVPYTQYMHYKLILASSTGSRYIFDGRKIMNPYFLATCALKESTTLHVTLRTLPSNKTILLNKDGDSNEEQINIKGELHLSTFDVLKCLLTLEGKQRGKFVRLLLQSFLRTYILQIPRLREHKYKPTDMTQTPYPTSTLHDLLTEDGCIIKCQQWEYYSRNSEEKQPRHPVLLLNGYSTESYCLPTEKKDLVRTLLEEGYETWLLQPRLHPLLPSTNFTIEDIGRFDIPAVIQRIIEVNGPNTKIHVIAHCVGGLSIHIALLGGYVSAVNIASLSCTNSSMFFKLATSALVKMRLPLIPITMALLGNNKTLSLHTSKDNLGHQLVKCIAQLIPRSECCTNKACNRFSGIFGNAFWHENITNTVHEWLINQSLQKLPMSGFPHLRKICTSGFIVDRKGKNTYLIHPERIPLPTLYISGGRSLLVTPETSFLANNFMKLHQPDFVHNRVVVEGFGHSDLLIGEDSCDKVFPHIISHLKIAEKEKKKELMDGKKEAVLSWQGSHDNNGELGARRFLFNILFLLLVICIGVLFVFSLFFSGKS